MTVCSTTLDGIPANVSRARRFVAGALRITPGITVPTHVVEVAELLTSELATNALRHTRSGEAGQTFRVRTRVDGRGAWVELHTEPPRRLHEAPRVVGADPGDESGRGLFLVARLATAWGMLVPPKEGVFFLLQWTPEQATALQQAAPVAG